MNKRIGLMMSRLVVRCFLVLIGLTKSNAWLEEELEEELDKFW
jgi:hypothetical protein